ncbi:MAG: PAS domain S-box protein, partial [Syntrophomonas sp.]|nr:PAS domain S-box protein [Syntrophomonas sp.]
MNQEYRETKGEKVQDLEQIPGVTAEQARDICSHSPSESESQLRLAPYRAIVEAQSDLISRSLPDYTLTFVNESYCRHFKKTREMLIGGCFLDLLAEEERPAVIASIESISVQKPLASHEERIISDNGEITWVEWSNRGIFDGQGRLVELQSVGRDITRRKQAENQLRLAMDRLEVRVKERTIELEKANQMLSEEITRHKMVEKALRESEEKFRKLAETAPALIFVLQGNKLSYVNTSMELATGFSREECQQGNFWDYVHPDFRQLTRERGLARLRGEDVPKRYEFKIIGKQ